MRLRRVLDDLTGRSRGRLAPLLLAQLDTADQGTALAARMCAGAISTAEARRRMGLVEHDGDGRRAGVVAELSAALTTPLDREDLYRFSRSVDDVLDNLRDFVRESDLYGATLGGTAGLDAAGLFAAVREGLGHLRTAVERVDRRPAEVTALALRARKAAGRVRQAYQRAMAALLDGEITADALKRRELLRRLDIVGLSLADCADTLSDAVLKRSH